MRKYKIGLILLLVFVTFSVCTMQATSFRQASLIAMCSSQGTEGVQSANSVATNAGSKVESFKENDKSGVGMTVAVMAIALFGLLLLYFIFKLIGNRAKALSSKRVMEVSGLTKEQAKGVAGESGELYAAIAMAIHEITEDTHDDENTVLTIKNVARNYSPWSSKIYTLRELPRR